ncbi:hypothetical protein DFH06DRAFT_1229678 [Mycena polygramma]|nr:hypothetical protein DFH06DRAFT_1229678 [Mycena polygramma]
MQVGSRIRCGIRCPHSRLFSSSRVSSIPRTPLPEPPSRPLALPFASVSSITQTDVDRYVAPLYERNWLIFPELPNMILVDNSLERSARTVSVLGKKFYFLRGRTATSFLADVGDLARQEEHEPKITMFLGRKKQHVLVRMHTERTFSADDGFLEANVRSALSGRDLRLAVLLENRYQEKYVASHQALPLPEMTRQPAVPHRDAILRGPIARSVRAAITIEVDANWTPSPLEMSPLPPLESYQDPATVCADVHFDTLLRPLYKRGWHATFLAVIGPDKLYGHALCLTGFYRFTSLTAAIAFVRDVAGYPWYQEDNAELHFLVDAQTVRAQLVYPHEHVALTVGNLRAARRIEQIFQDNHFGSARMSDVHPYRNHDSHQPKSVAELQRTREVPLRQFHQRHNVKMMRM